MFRSRVNLCVCSISISLFFLCWIYYLNIWQIYYYHYLLTYDLKEWKNLFILPAWLFHCTHTPPRWLVSWLVCAKEMILKALKNFTLLSLMMFFLVWFCSEIPEKKIIKKTINNLFNLLETSSLLLKCVIAVIGYTREWHVLQGESQK